MQLDETERRATDWLQSEDLARRLSHMDMEAADDALRSGLAALDGRLELLGVGEKPRGITRMIELSWRSGPGRAEHKSTILLPATTP